MSEVPLFQIEHVASIPKLNEKYAVIKLLWQNHQEVWNGILWRPIMSAEKNVEAD